MRTFLKKIIAQNLKDILADKGMSQNDLAKKSGCTKGQISEWIGEKRAITNKNLLKLAIALDVPLDKLTRENIDSNKGNPGELEETVRMVIRQEIHTEVSKLFKQECEDLKRFFAEKIEDLEEKQKPLREGQAPTSKAASLT